MCDDFTSRAHDEALARRGLTRRQFSALGVAAVLAGCTTHGQTGLPLAEETVRITTQDGLADAFFVYPAKGAHPGVVLWPDIAGLREAFRIMARRLAGAGYAVLAVNQYYRSAPAPVMESFSEYLTDAGQALAARYGALLTGDATARDAQAFVAFLDGKEAVDTQRGIGTNGYCMGGPMTVRTAAAAPARVKAAASLHGASLVTGQPDSPDKLIGGTRASYLFAIARNDDQRAPDVKNVLRQDVKAANRPAEIEVYHADHGWCVPDTPAYDPVEADRAWQRMLALFAGL